MALDPIVALRRMTDEPTDVIYSDSELQDRVDNADSLQAAARDIWGEKLAAAAALVNISEGGSSRSMSQAYDHYKEMFELYSSLADSAGGGAGSNSPVLRKIVRT